jgi:MoaA/NifB/PqqE/SkfB family radical SAM enzyme
MCVTLDNTISYTPCCRYIHNDSTRYDVSTISFLEYKKSEFVKNISKNMEMNWDSGCLKCKKEEDAGFTSLRERYNSLVNTVGDLEFIELSVSNDCNLTCKMCNNDYSSKWQSVVDHSKHKLTEWFFENNVKPVTVSNLFNGIDLSKLKRIKYLGGEPFVTTEIKELFDFLGETSNRIDFVCNTNCTFFPEKLLNKLVKFKIVYLNLSVDGIGDLCNYIRTGSSWDTVLANILKWIEFSKKNPNIKINMFTTAQAYNFHQIDKINDFAESIGIEYSSVILKNPNYLSYQILPIKYREEILQQLKFDTKLKKYLDITEFNPVLFEKFKRYTLTVDGILNTSIEKTIPNLYKFF